MVIHLIGVNLKQIVCVRTRRHSSLKQIRTGKLPPGFEVDPECEQPTVLLEPMHLRNLPWLRNRGYNTFGIYIISLQIERK